VPASVGPLPLDEGLGEQARARVVGETQTAGHSEGIPFLRGAAANEAVELTDAAPVLRARQPVEDGLRGGHGSRLTRWHPELHERDEPPVRARPFWVGPDAEAAVGLLTRQEGPNPRPLEDLRLVLGPVLAENVASRQQADGR